VPPGGSDAFRRHMSALRCAAAGLPIHAPNESVDPAEIAAMALTEALFFQHYATAAAGRHPPAGS
jgi:hypothetical protein